MKNYTEIKGPTCSQVLLDTIPNIFYISRLSHILDKTVGPNILYPNLSGPLLFCMIKFCPQVFGHDTNLFHMLIFLNKCLYPTRDYLLFRLIFF